MLVAFLKKAQEQRVDCSIIKFTERIWIEESGLAKILRTFVVRVNASSQEGITGIEMLIPFHIRNDDFHDATTTALDPEYFWNRKESGEYRIIDASRAEIEFDSIEPIIVPERIFAHPITTIDHLSLISIDFNQAISPGQSVLVRCQLQVSSLATRLETGDLSFHFEYLSYDTARRQASEINLRDREIPVISILDNSTRDGGFDVFIAPPRKREISADPVSSSVPAHTVEDIDGQGEKIRGRCWRLRFLPGDPTQPRKANAGMTVSGNLIKSQIFSRIEELDKASTRRDIVTILLSFIAIYLALAAGFRWFPFK